eukprot:364164-Chlamydomonas_euryale.AAC.2
MSRGVWEIPHNQTQKLAKHTLLQRPGHAAKLTTCVRPQEPHTSSRHMPTSQLQGGRRWVERSSGSGAGSSRGRPTGIELSERASLIHPLLSKPHPVDRPGSLIHERACTSPRQSRLQKRDARRREEEYRVGEDDTASWDATTAAARLCLCRRDLPARACPPPSSLLVQQLIVQPLIVQPPAASRGYTRNSRTVPLEILDTSATFRRWCPPLTSSSPRHGPPVCGTGLLSAARA